MYPRVGFYGDGQSVVPPGGRPSPHHNMPPSSSSGLGIRVAIKPECRLTPPPPLCPHLGDISGSKFQFDFDFERKVLAEARKVHPNWSRLGLADIPPKRMESIPSKGPPEDPLVRKYIASGLNREAVPLALANYGDNPAKVKAFIDNYTVLRDMGFPPSKIAEALLNYDNDMDKALAHFLS